MHIVLQKEAYSLSLGSENNLKASEASKTEKRQRPMTEISASFTSISPRLSKFFPTATANLFCGGTFIIQNAVKILCNPCRTYWWKINAYLWPHWKVCHPSLEKQSYWLLCHLLGSTSDYTRAHWCCTDRSWHWSYPWLQILRLLQWGPCVGEVGIEQI